MAAGSCSSSRSAAIGSGRTPPCSLRRRATLGKAGSSTSARGSARSGWRSLSAHRSRPSIFFEIDPELARLAESNAERNGLQSRTRVLRLDALNPRERREAGLAESADCVVTNPPFFDAKAVRASPDEGKARAHVLAGAEAGATLADWIQASLAILAPGGRFVMIHRPDALSADPRRDRKPARRAGASAGSSDDRRERASSAGLGRERLQGAAAACAGAGPARGRRPADG